MIRIRSSLFAGLFFTGIAISIGSILSADEEMVPDFSLLDVNPASSTFDQPVSPRDYLQQASGWYFADAT